MFIDRLVKAVRNKKSNVVVGLDPRIELIPAIVKHQCYQDYGKTLRGVAEAIVAFNQEIINHIFDIVPAIKPQIAFYEQYGLEGLEAYIKTCQYAREKGLLVIGDIKRGDIGTTSRAYSNAHLGEVKVEGKSFETFAVDAITVNPYLGDDCLREFIADIKERNKGMFILVKTSNPTSGQLQDLRVGDETVYEKVAEMVDSWSKETLGTCGYASVGAVVAATYPQQAKKLRRLMPKTYFLVPGYGAQGGTAEDIVDCFNEDGLGAIINSSRGILFAYQKDEKGYGEENYGEAARIEALNMRNAINHALQINKKGYW